MSVVKALRNHFLYRWVTMQYQRRQQHPPRRLGDIHELLKIDFFYPKMRIFETIRYIHLLNTHFYGT